MRMMIRSLIDLGIRDSNLDFDGFMASRFDIGSRRSTYSLRGDNYLLKLNDGRRLMRRYTEPYYTWGMIHNSRKNLCQYIGDMGSGIPRGKMVFR